ncbi:MAG: flagellar hook-length control protein FliK [Bacillota bacterium]
MQVYPVEAEIKWEPVPGKLNPAGQDDFLDILMSLICECFKQVDSVQNLPGLSTGSQLPEERKGRAIPENLSKDCVRRAGVILGLPDRKFFLVWEEADFAKTSPALVSNLPENDVCRLAEVIPALPDQRLSAAQKEADSIASTAVISVPVNDANEAGAAVECGNNNVLAEGQQKLVPGTSTASPDHESSVIFGSTGKTAGAPGNQKSDDLFLNLAATGFVRVMRQPARESILVKVIEDLPVPGDELPNQFRPVKSESADIQDFLHQGSVLPSKTTFQSTTQSITNGAIVQKDGISFLAEEVGNLSARPGSELADKDKVTQTLQVEFNRDPVSPDGNLVTLKPGGGVVHSLPPNATLIAAQVVSAIRQVVAGRAQTMLRVKLEPEQLGEVTILLTYSKGKLNASFYTTTHLAKEAVEASFPHLREILAGHNIRLENATAQINSGHEHAGTESYSPDGYSRENFFTGRFPAGETHLSQEAAVIPDGKIANIAQGGLNKLI